jgi:hypothetical protein
MSADPQTTSQQCGSCQRWVRVNEGAGNCWPQLPFWFAGEPGCATWETDGKDCVAWSAKSHG